MEFPLDMLELDKTPASDVKVKGWPSLMRKVQANGAILITNHNHPEAVVLDADRYRWLVDQVASIAEADPQARVLKALQAKFDDHLVSLGNDATLARVLGKPASRGKKIRLGKPL